MKRTRRLFFIISFLMIVPTIVAHTLKDVYIDVMLNDNGNARIVSRYHYTIKDKSNSTEAYVKMYNLGVMEFGEVQVTDETGVQYTYEDNWEIERSRAEKEHRCGIYQGENGPEICWGIGKGGDRTYELRYTLTRLVKSYKDFDGFNHNFYEANKPFPQHVRVTIARENGKFTTDDTRMWAFGFYGTVNVIDGKIVAETNQPMTKEGEKVCIIAQWEKGLFHPHTYVKQSFRSVKKKAFVGSDYSLQDENADESKASLYGSGYNKESEAAIWSKAVDILGKFLGAIMLALLPFALLGGIFILVSRVNKRKEFKRVFGNKEGRVEQISPEIPFNGDLVKAKAVLNAIEPTNNNNLVAAFFLRMIYQGYLTVERMFDAKGNMVQVLKILEPGIKPPQDTGETDNTVSLLLQKLLWGAAGEDHVLEPDEFKTYMRTDPVQHREKVKELKDLLEDNPYLSLKKLTPEDTQTVFGLKKYLQEFIRTDNLSLGEVALWKEYMVYATLFGIAPQVSSDLKKVWPDDAIDINEILVDKDSLTSILWATNANRHMNYVSHYETPEERQARMNSERSSGGGGSSSYGGGGGFSGGGGSGIR